MTYEHWKRIVDAYLLRLCGMTSDELEAKGGGGIEWDYYIAWDCNMSPKVAAERALKAALTAVGW